MNKNDIFHKISSYLIEDFEIPSDKITLESRLFEELDLDSIDAIDLIVKLQELTGEKMTPESFKEVRTIADVVEKVERIIQEK